MIEIVAYIMFLCIAVFVLTFIHEVFKVEWWEREHRKRIKKMMEEKKIREDLLSDD